VHLFGKTSATKFICQREVANNMKASTVNWPWKNWGVGTSLCNRNFGQN